MEKFNCFKCKHRGEVPGSCHSSCNHPDIADVRQDSFGEVLAIFASVERVAPVKTGFEKLGIKGNDLGIRKGWFNWPFDFDPVWLDSCNGYEEKRNKDE